MSDDGGMCQIAVYVPQEAKEILDEQEGTQSDILTESLFDTFGGRVRDTAPTIKRGIENKQQKIRQLQDKKSELKREKERQIREYDEQIERCEEDIAGAKERIAELEERLVELQEEQQSYEESLDELLDDMVENPRMHVDATYSGVKERAREEYGSQSKENRKQVVEDLKDRADERGLDLPDKRFMDKRYSGGGV